MLKITGAFLLLSLSVFAADRPKPDASAEELAKSSWLRNETIEIYKHARAAKFFAVAYGSEIGNLTKQFNNLRLDYFETVAREENQNVYLLAVERLPTIRGLDAEVYYKNPKRTDKPKFWLMIDGLEGCKARTEKALAELKVTSEENLKRLKDTGYLRKKD